MTGNTLSRREALEQEKKTIIQELAHHAKADPHVRDRFQSVLQDLGTEFDDSVHEVEQQVIDSALIETLANRLEDINEELATLA